MAALRLALIAFLFSTAALGSDAEWRAHHEAGLAALNRNDPHAALRSYEAALKVAERFLGEDQIVHTALDLANAYARVLRFDDAEQLMRRALTSVERRYGSENQVATRARNQLLAFMLSQSRFAELESLATRTLASLEKSSPDGQAMAHVLTTLASAYVVQARLVEAEPLARRALAIFEKSGAPAATDAGTARILLAAIYFELGRDPEAEAVAKRALAIFDARPDALSRVWAWNASNTLAMVYQRQGRHAEAEPFIERHVAFIEDLQRQLGTSETPQGKAVRQMVRSFLRPGDTLPPIEAMETVLRLVVSAHRSDSAAAAKSRLEVGALLLRHGRHEEARPHFEYGLGIAEYRFGRDHSLTALALSGMAAVRRAQKDYQSSLVFYQRANAIFTARYAAHAHSSRRGALAELRARSTATLEGHASLLGEIAAADSAKRATAGAEAFVIAQYARASDTAEQVARMAARYASGRDELAQLARARQDALVRLERLDTETLLELNSAQDGEPSEREKRLSSDQQAVRRSIAELDARVEREYPQYRELTDPRPLELAATARFLAPNEALAAFLVLQDESLLWIVKRDGAEFHRLSVGREELANSVRTLRRQLDLGVGDPDRVLARPFNVAAAHSLYRKLFGAAESSLAGVTHLMVVPDGALSSLPLGVLVTELPAKPVEAVQDHGTIAWLAQKHAITVLPAVNSLRALRQFAKPSAAREPFGGFGDPLLDGRNDARRAMIASLYSRGVVADVRDVRKLARLPESADELRAIAKALNAPPENIRLGAAATERAVKQSDLTRYRNLAFATHGLMAGQFRGLAEPALVLTPPTQGSELDDGLLTASEISQLKLDADWVVLSACNTAAPDGTPGAEGLSGLARAFFYAGARSLLVSHWSVNSEATVALTTRMFEESANGVPKAEALRRSMLHLMNRKDMPEYAHPAFWAPFVVVGEGAR